MPDFTTADVRELRERAGISTSEATRLLTRANGDMQKAIELGSRRALNAEDRLLDLEAAVEQQSAELAALREMVELFVPKP